MSQPHVNSSSNTLSILKGHEDSRKVTWRLQRKTGGRYSNPAIKFSDFVNGADTTITMTTKPTDDQLVKSSKW
jgi:hypothetical protein